MQEKMIFERSDVSQESQYAFPYHYIPSFEDGHFCQHLYWPWGLHYLGGTELVLSILKEEPFESLADIGCGDGRFLREVNTLFPQKKLTGIDYSSRAINLAKAMNPSLNYKCLNINSKRTLNQTFDVLTLVEVLEHIPVESVNDFVHSLSDCQKSGGRLILTVPHKNKRTLTKHYQHFDSASLIKVVEPCYKLERIVFIDKITRICSRLISCLLGNSFFILNNRIMLDALFNIYRRYFLICNESHCGRILLIGRRR